MVVELTLLRVVVVYLVKQVGIEVGPLLKGKLLAEQARCHVVGDECCLDEQGTGTAHRVDEVGFSLPAGHHNHAGSQHLIQRSLYRLLAIAATVERFSTGVKTQCALVFCNMDVQSDVGVADADIRALPCALTELVNDGVLDLVCYKF